jgi:hypothetical protein
MRELAELQALFGAGLDASASDRDALQIFRGGPEQARRRFGIYRGNAAANAAKAMAAAYPVVEKIVGPEFFAGLAREYQSRHPSETGDLNEYGQDFAAFLADFPPAKEIPYLADVAQLEWLVHRAHYAADPAPFDPARLASVPAEQQLQLRPRLHPACAILHSAHPLARIWQVHRDTVDSEFEVDFSQGPSHALVFRPRFRVKVAQTGDAEAAFLVAALAGATLEAALAAAQVHDASFDLGRSLNEWVGSSVIVDFTLSSTLGRSWSLL